MPKPASPVPTREEQTNQPSRPASIRLALAALSLGGFGIGLTEFVVSGLLTEIASDLDVSIPVAGQLVGAYALAVVPGALVVTPLLMRRPPKHALMVLLVFFVVGNVLSAWAPAYAVMLLGRVVAALAHGGYFGIGAVLAGSLVPAGKQASAVSMLFAGLTIANVLGVPLGAYVGQQAGWRVVFWLIAALGLAALVGLGALVPATDPEPDQLPIGQQFRRLASLQVVASLSATALVFGGMFGVFAFIEPLLRDVSGFSAGAVPWLLVLFGVGLFAGNVLGGRAADRDPDRAVLWAAAALVAVIVGLGAVAGWRVPIAIAVALLGVAGFAAVPGLQARVMRHASGATTLASAANIAAFNAGNALGVALAGGAIALGFGLRSPAVTGAALALLGLGVVAVAVTRTGHRPS